MSNYLDTQIQLNLSQGLLITGVAGFIGSNLLEQLLMLDQNVVGLDNFATGYSRNLDEVENSVTKAQWQKFNFIEGDIRKYETCISAVGVDYVCISSTWLGTTIIEIHDSNSVNISRFLNILHASKQEKVKVLHMQPVALLTAIT